MSRRPRTVLTAQEISARGREAFNAKLAALADPLGLLSPDDRAARVAQLRHDWFASIGRKGGLAKAEYDRADRENGGTR